MMIRIWNLFRRFGHQPLNHRFEEPILSGQLGARLVNPATYEVYLGGQRVMLTASEFRLLHLLVKNRGTAISHETLKRALWGEGAGGFDQVNQQVQVLRRKFAG
jgi:DNA-binding response OmpR family regulator